MGNTLSKPYLALFAEARKKYDLDAMENILKELCEELGVQDPPSQAEEQAKEQANTQAAFNIGKALAEQRNALNQGTEKNGVIGKKV